LAFEISRLDYKLDVSDIYRTYFIAIAVYLSCTSSAFIFINQRKWDNSWSGLTASWSSLKSISRYYNSCADFSFFLYQFCIKINAVCIVLQPPEKSIAVDW